MLQRRLVVLPPLLAAVLATVAGVGRDSSDYGGEYGPASRPICPTFLLYLFDTAHPAAGRNICFKFGACLCAAACGPQSVRGRLLLCHSRANRV